jgi:hypothetical protein
MIALGRQSENLSDLAPATDAAARVHARRSIAALPPEQGLVRGRTSGSESHFLRRWGAPVVAERRPPTHMMPVEAHVGGIPIEETLLGLLPLGWALIAGVRLGAQRLRRSPPSKVPRIRKEPP